MKNSSFPPYIKVTSQLKISFILAILAMFSWGTLSAQVQIYQESFETNGNGSRYSTSPAEFSTGTNGCNDFFTRKQDEADAANNTTCPSALYNDPANEDGTFFFASEDDDNGSPQTVTLNGQTVTGQSSLDVRILLATPRTGRFDTGDFFDVKYQMDGNPVVTVASFHSVGGTNTDLALDTNNDNIGDGTALTQNFQDFTFPIPATGNSLVISIEMGQNGGTEELAFDNVRIFGVAAVNNSPVLAAIESGVLGYIENAGPVQITNTLTVTDSDDTDQAGATVSIINGLRSCEDVLSFSNQNGITGSYNSNLGVLTLTGTSSNANYQTALRSIQYTNTNTVHPDTVTRTIRFTCNDGTSNSNSQDRTISITRSLSAAGSLPYIEDFETDGNGTRYDANQHNDGANDLWDRLDNTSAQVITPGGINGSFYFAGNDIDGTIGNPADNCENGNIDPSGDGIIQLRDINISGFANLQVTLAAAAMTVSGWESTPPDFITVEAEIDGGGFAYVGGWFGNGINLELDVNGNQLAGPGGTTLNATFQDGTFNIPGTGNVLSLRVIASNNSGAEEFGVDNIRVTGSLACTATTVTTQPGNSTVCPNTPAAFTADTTGGTADSLRWHFSTDGGATWNPLSDGAPYSGTATLNLGINPATLGMNATQYRLVVYSCSGIATDSSSAATLTTFDPIPPSITCPNDTILLAGPTCQANYSWVAPTPTDNCPGVIAVGSLNSPQVFSVGVNPIAYVATDASGNTDTCSWNVIPLVPTIWNEFVGSAQSNDTLYRTLPGKSWGTSGAATVQALAPNTDGSIFHIIGSNKWVYFFGFSETNIDAFNTSIDHAFYVQKNSLFVREASGTNIYAGPVNIGDTLALRRVGSQMVWFVNSTPVYFNPAINPNQVLFGDVAMYKAGTALTNIFVDFCTTAPLAVRGDVINNVCAPSSTGAIDISVSAGTPPYTFAWSHGPTSEDVTGLEGGNYTVTVTDAMFNTAMATFSVLNRMSWMNPTGANASVDTLIKTVSGNNWGTSGARSMQVLQPDSSGSFTHIVKTSNKYYYIGFENDYQGPSQFDLDYSFYVAAGQLRIREATGYFAVEGSVSVGDSLMIERVGSTINYYQNGNLVRTTSANASDQLLVAATIYNANLMLCNNFVSFCNDSLVPDPLTLNTVWEHAGCFANDGSAMVTPVGGTPPFSYNWTPNISATGMIAGQPAGNYTCVVSDNAGQTDSVSFELFNKVVWENTVGTVANGDSLMRTAAGAGWGDAGARSDNKLLNGTDGKVVHIVHSVGTNYYFGLSDADTDQSQATIDYSIYNHKGNLKIREEDTGFNQFIGVTVAVGDTLTVERRISSVFYYKNDSLLRSIGTGSTETLRVDVSMYTSGMELYNVYVDFCDTIAGQKQAGPGGQPSASQPEAGSSEVVLFPNPTTGTFVLGFVGGNRGNAVLELMDIYGKSLIHREVSVTEGVRIEESFDLSSRAPGTYLLRMNLGDRVITRKVIKY